MRKFYQTYSNSSTLSMILDITNSSSTMTNSGIRRKSFYKMKAVTSFFKLTWSHYGFLMRIDNEKERRFYGIESERYNWSVRELKRQ